MSTFLPELLNWNDKVRIAPINEIQTVLAEGTAVIVNHNNMDYVVAHNSPKYQLISNEQLINDVEFVLKENNIKFKNKYWNSSVKFNAVIETQTPIKVGGRDGTLRFFVRNSYNGTTGTSIMIGAFIKICVNGLVSMREGCNIKLSHRSSTYLGKDDEQLKSKIGNAVENIMKMGTAIEELKSKQIDEKINEGIINLPRIIVERALEETIKKGDYTQFGLYDWLTHLITNSEYNINARLRFSMMIASIFCI